MKLIMEKSLDNKKLLLETVFSTKKTYEKTLAEYKISQFFGFRAYNNFKAVKLNENFSKYEEIFNNLYKLNSSGQITEEINKIALNENLSKIDFFEKLPEDILNKLFTIFSCLGNSYMTNLPKGEKVKFPKQLAMPYYYISKLLEIRSSFCLWSNINGVQIKQNCPEEYSFENCEMSFTVTNTDTEHYFLAIYGVIAIKFNSVFEILFNVNNIAYKHLLKNNDFSNLDRSDIESILKELEKLEKLVDYIIEHCKVLLNKMDPDDYFNNLRLFLKGYSQFEEGVEFEGVGKTFHYAGASAGQDPYTFLLKSILNLQYTKEYDFYQNDLKIYFRVPHRNFIENIAGRSCFVEILQANEELNKRYAICQERLQVFYKVHNAYVKNFIVKPASKHGLKEDEINGTGNTPIKKIYKLHNLINIKPN